MTDEPGWDGPTQQQDDILDARHSFEGYVRNEPYGRETWGRNARGEDYRLPTAQAPEHSRED